MRKQLLFGLLFLATFSLMAQKKTFKKPNSRSKACAACAKPVSRKPPMPSKGLNRPNGISLPTSSWYSTTPTRWLWTAFMRPLPERDTTPLWPRPPMQCTTSCPCVACTPAKKKRTTKPLSSLRAEIPSVAKEIAKQSQAGDYFGRDLVSPS